jgi:lipid-binding SYLF domain-containing protein
MPLIVQPFLLQLPRRPEHLRAVIPLNMRRGLVLLVLLTLSLGAWAQSKDLQKADARAEKASEILSTFSTLLGDDSVAGKLLKRAKAVVIVEAVLTDGLLDKEIRGHGVLSFNEKAGWSLPTFINCKGIRMEWGRSIFRPKQRVEVVFLFMDDQSFGLIDGWTDKGPKIKGNKLALGPIVNGKGADLVESTASVIYYSFEGRKLSGEEFPNTRLGSALRLSHDNDMNKKVFGKKFDQIHTSGAQPIAIRASLERVSALLNARFVKGDN